MPSPLRLADRLFSFESDTALDAHDRLYFVDTYGPDLWFSSWRSGPAWERTAPLVTPSAFDDRPWLAAQGDGIVYMLTTDIGTHARAGDAFAAPPGSTSWAIVPVLFRSTDRGETWAPVRAFNQAHFCGLGASPIDTRTVTVVCADATHLRAYTTHDRGTRWSESVVFAFKKGPVPKLSVAYDSTGTAYTAFIDAVTNGNRLYVARSVRSGWKVRDVTPFRGSFREVWTTARGRGVVGIGFYATRDVAPGPSSEWFVYGGVSSNGAAAKPRWWIARADPRPVIHAPYAPPDFMQVTLDPFGTLFVAYSRESATDLVHATPSNFDHDIYVAREISRPR